MDMIPQDSMPRKQCTGPCGRLLPATPEFFYRNKGMKDGLVSRCKHCASQYEKKRWETSEYREYQRTYRSLPDVKERRREHKQAFYNTPHGSEWKNAYDQAYWKTYNPPPEVRERQRNFHKTYDPIWRNQLGGKEWHRVYEQSRRAHNKAIPGTLTQEQIQYKLKAQHYTCYYCFVKFEKRGGRYIYHLEHTIPIVRTECEPRHDINYVVLSCPSCNRKKHDKLPHEFPEGGRLF